MKSAVITVTSDGQGIIDALSMTERFGIECGLDQKSVLHLRLLAEELFGMLRSIAGDVEASYWLDTQANHVEIHMKSDVEMNIEMREQFLSAASSGKNEAAKSFMGKIRDMIAEILLSAQDSLSYPMMDTVYLSPMENMSGDYLWSMTYYMEELQRRMEETKEAADAWDELEKSIVAKIADDVKVKMKGNNVEIILYKSF